MLPKLKVLKPQSSPSLPDTCSAGECNGSGVIYSMKDNYTNARVCECVKAGDRLKILGERFTSIHLDAIMPRNAKQRRLKEILAMDPSTPVFVSGDVRTGKTHFLAAMFTHWHKKSSRVKYLDDQRLKDELRNAELNGDMSFVYDLVKDNRYIFIDDVGKASMSDFHRSALHRFFNELYKNNRHIFITSNDSLATLGAQEYWGKAVARRVEDLCEIVEF
jgi:DNA replication protein DnaC